MAGTRNSRLTTTAIRSTSTHSPWRSRTYNRGQQRDSPFADAVGRLANYARQLSDHHFHLPQIGDDDGGMLFAMCGGDVGDVGPAISVAAALLERRIWPTAGRMKNWLG